MYFVHGHDVSFDRCFSNFKYTLFERLMMQQEDYHFVMVQAGGLACIQFSCSCLKLCDGQQCNREIWIHVAVSSFRLCDTTGEVRQSFGQLVS